MIASRVQLNHLLVMAYLGLFFGLGASMGFTLYTKYLR